MLVIAMALGCDEQDSASSANADPERLVFVFQKQKEPEALAEAADRVGQALSASLGIPVEVRVPLAYSASVQALVSGQADVAYVSSVPFLLARRDGGARLILAEQRGEPGSARTEYDAVMVVRADSDLETIDDLRDRAEQVRFCFTSPTSTSGYLFACKRLVEEGVMQAGQDPSTVFAESQFGGGYAQALRQVLSGAADVAAVSSYTVEGPGADVYLSETERAKLRVLARTPGVPTHLVCVRGGLSDALADRVREALLTLADEQPELLTDVYGTASFAEVDEDTHVSASIEAVDAAGVPLAGLTK